MSTVEQNNYNIEMKLSAIETSLKSRISLLFTLYFVFKNILVKH